MKTQTQNQPKRLNVPISGWNVESRVGWCLIRVGLANIIVKSDSLIDFLKPSCVDYPALNELKLI